MVNPASNDCSPLSPVYSPPHLDSTLVKMFWWRVMVADGCWLWRGSRLPTGYGTFAYKQKRYYAHRLSWEIHNGPFPKSDRRVCVCHSCDNPRCVNPLHLFLGGMHENMRDMVLKGRGNWRRGERHGMSKLTAEQARSIYHDSRILRKIASEYGVGETTVRGVKSGATWSHVTGAQYVPPRNAIPLSRARRRL